MTDKNPEGKSGFDFSRGFVLAEELVASACHQCEELYTYLIKKNPDSCHEIRIFFILLNFSSKKNHKDNAYYNKQTAYSKQYFC
jgi:hypothetical protein